jgi:hypothetical protein
MAEPFDDWPNDSTFYPGPPKHLHAVGVLSSRYNAFEQLIFNLYMHHNDKKKVPARISEQFYWSRDEQNRINLLKDTFKDFERRKKVKEIIENLADYFFECWKIRNGIIHGYVYPTLIANQRELQLVTQAKKSRKRTYLDLDLPTIRECADCMALGRKQAADIAIFLQHRDTTPSRRSLWLRSVGPRSLPKTIHIPKRLLRLVHPPDHPIQPSRQGSLNGKS